MNIETIHGVVKSRTNTDNGCFIRVQVGDAVWQVYSDTLKPSPGDEVSAVGKAYTQDNRFHRGLAMRANLVVPRHDVHSAHLLRITVLELQASEQRVEIKALRKMVARLGKAVGRLAEHTGAAPELPLECV